MQKFHTTVHALLSVQCKLKGCMHASVWRPTRSRRSSAQEEDPEAKTVLTVVPKAATADRPTDHDQTDRRRMHGTARWWIATHAPRASRPRQITGQGAGRGRQSQAATAGAGGHHTARCPTPFTDRAAVPVHAAHRAPSSPPRNAHAHALSLLASLAPPPPLLSLLPPPS